MILPLLMLLSCSPEEPPSTEPSAATARATETFGVPRQRFEHLLSRPRPRSMAPRRNAAGDIDAYVAKRTGDLHDVMHLKEGDAILAINGVTMDGDDALFQGLGELLTADVVTLDIERANKRLSLAIDVSGDPASTPERWPPHPDSFLSLDTAERRLRAGVHVTTEGDATTVQGPRAAMTGALRPGSGVGRFSFDDVGGQPMWLVTTDPRGPLAMIGVDNRDGLLSIDDRPIQDPEDLLQILTSLAVRNDVVLQVSRLGKPHTITVSISGDPLEAPDTWSVDQLDIRKTLHSVGGARAADGTVTVPRSAMMTLLDPDTAPEFGQVEAGDRVAWSVRPDAQGILMLVGMQRGDVLLRLGDTDITTRSDVQRVIEALLTESKVEVAFERRGLSKQASLVIEGKPARLPADWGPEHVQVFLTPLAVGIRHKDGTAYVKRDALTGIDADSVHDLARMMPHRSTDGEADGVRLSAVRRDSLLDHLGIRNGDVVNQVNGTLANETTLTKGLLGLKTGTPLALALTRRGEAMTLRYEIDPS